MSTPQPGTSGIDVRLDEQGRIIITLPDLARASASTEGNPSGGHIITNSHCVPVNTVIGCGAAKEQ
ncbi:hypothetical protein ABZW30_25580 [Kitasatospora sp. NPDC004669]|uniref:hypothetical protein n=1 Tax=Kitasatospora sp. NPDC004669 TaxID=3154555 RepID=UPI0033AC1DAA